MGRTLTSWKHLFFSTTSNLGQGWIRAVSFPTYNSELIDESNELLTEMRASNGWHHVTSIYWKGRPKSWWTEMPMSDDCPCFFSPPPFETLEMHIFRLYEAGRRVVFASMGTVPCQSRWWVLCHMVRMWMSHLLGVSGCFLRQTQSAIMFGEFYQSRFYLNHTAVEPHA